MFPVLELNTYKTGVLPFECWDKQVHVTLWFILWFQGRVAAAEPLTRRANQVHV